MDSCKYPGTEKRLLHVLQIVVAIAEKHRRPAIPPESELPGGSFPGLPAYLDLMQACWDEEPELRPSFESCIITLRGLLEQAIAVKYALHFPVCSPVCFPERLPGPILVWSRSGFLDLPHNFDFCRKLEQCYLSCIACIALHRKCSSIACVYARLHSTQDIMSRCLLVT